MSQTVGPLFQIFFQIFGQFFYFDSNLCQSKLLKAWEAADPQLQHEHSVGSIPPQSNSVLAINMSVTVVTPRGVGTLRSTDCVSFTGILVSAHSPT